MVGKGFVGLTENKPKYEEVVSSESIRGISIKTTGSPEI
jgi:hypothetical protein